MVNDITGAPLNSFKLPSEWIVHPLRAKELRVIRHNGVAHRLRLDDHGGVVERNQELPTDIVGSSLPLLVLFIDQGGIGTAVFYYLLSQGVMLSLRFDPFHRAVNDIKGACRAACGGLFRRVMLFSAFIFGINYGPFGKGANFFEKKAMLEHFYAQVDAYSPEFRNFAIDYAKDNGMRHSSDADFEDIFDSLADMASVNFKGPLTKLMRWFSWWENYNFHRRELRGLKGIIAYYLGLEGANTVDERLHIPSGMDAATELRQLKQQQGGFRLVHRLITDDLLDAADTLYDVGQPSWTAHTKRAENVKSPRDGMLNYFSMTSRDQQRLALIIGAPGASHQMVTSEPMARFIFHVSRHRASGLRHWSRTRVKTIHTCMLTHTSAHNYLGIHEGIHGYPHTHAWIPMDTFVETPGARAWIPVDTYISL